MGFMGKKKQMLPASRMDAGGKPGLVSIVLPVYNGEAYLGEAIQSVMQQTYPVWELIIIDDGSTDKSLSVAREYEKEDERIRVVHQENQKLPRALNHGFSLAGGEFYTWISADNRFLPEFLATMVGELRKHKKADMVFGNQYLIDEKGERITGHGWFELPPKSGTVCFPPATILLNTVANNTIGAAFLYRAGCEAVLGGYSPYLFLLEDYDYFMRMNSLFHIRHISRREPVYEYRFHPDSLTAHDEDLKITASRPRLMEFDSYRRKCYPKRVEADFSALPKGVQAQLKKAGFVQQDGAKTLILWEDAVEKKKELVYRMIPEERDRCRVCKGQETLAMLRNCRDAAVFLRLRTLSDRLRLEEKEFF